MQNFLQIMAKWWPTVLAAGIGVWLGTQVPTCSRGNDLIEGIQKTQQASSELLLQAVTSMSDSQQTLLDYQIRMNQEWEEHRALLDAKLEDQKKALERKLSEVDHQIAAALATERAELRSYYEYLLRNPESVGPEFDGWTTPSPDYWSGPRSGDGPNP